MSTYLLTGASGAVGSAVVPLLLADPIVTVCLLLRANSAQHLNERLATLFSFWGIDERDESTRRRVRPLRGDVTKPALGLEPASYAALGESCTHIIHCAGQVRMNLAMDEARRHAVGAARNVVELGAVCRHSGQLQKIEFVSTVGVGGRTRVPLEEGWVRAEREFHNSYEVAKAEAELYVAEQIDHGLPITVHRPSMVVGDSTTGRIIHFQIFYHLCEFLSGRRTWGLYPDLGESRLDIIPVDYVAASLVWSSKTSQTTGRILHLCSGPEQAIRLTALRATVRQMFAAAGRSVPISKKLPLSWFRASIPIISLLSAGYVRRAISTLPLFLDYLGDNPVFSVKRSRAILAPAEIPLPQPGVYLDPVIDYYLRAKHA